MKFSVKSGRNCLAVFKVISSHPAAFSGQWWSIVSGFWAPEERFIAYASLLESIATSYQINDAWAISYIQSAIENLKRLQRKTRQSIQELHQARYDQQRSWEANQARKDYSNWKFSNYLRGETNWVSDLEGGKVYHTDTWGTKDNWTGDYYEGAPYEDGLKIHTEFVVRHAEGKHFVKSLTRQALKLGAQELKNRLIFTYTHREKHNFLRRLVIEDISPAGKTFWKLELQDVTLKSKQAPSSN